MLRRLCFKGFFQSNLAYPQSFQKVSKIKQKANLESSLQAPPAVMKKGSQQQE